MYALSTAPSSGWEMDHRLHHVVFCGRLSIGRLEESLLDCEMKMHVLDIS